MARMVLLLSSCLLLFSSCLCLHTLQWDLAGPSLQKVGSVSLSLKSALVTYFGQKNVTEARMWSPDDSRSFTYISALPFGGYMEQRIQPSPSHPRPARPHPSASQLQIHEQAQAGSAQPS